MSSGNRSQAAGLLPETERRVGVYVGGLARILALVGGAVLLLLAALTVVSVTGRAFVKMGLGPVPGDFELVEAGCAFAVFAFLPWCQFQRGHATVDVFIGWAGPRARAGLALVSNILLTAVAGFIAWRLQAGLVDKLSYGETTFILQMPAWYGYAASLVGAVVFAVVCVYTVWRSLNEVLGQGEPIQ
jgi:TRAP-type C4-dicarboxylate transport system permease small subunit